MSGPFSGGRSAHSGTASTGARGTWPSHLLRSGRHIWISCRGVPVDRGVPLANHGPALSVHEPRSGRFSGGRSAHSGTASTGARGTWPSHLPSSPGHRRSRVSPRLLVRDPAGRSTEASSPPPTARQPPPPGQHRDSCLAASLGGQAVWGAPHSYDELVPVGRVGGDGQPQRAAGVVVAGPEGLEDRDPAVFR